MTITAPRPLSDNECQRRLLDAADDMFNRSGTHTVAIADIARRAGVPAGRAADVIGSKDALIEAVLDVQHERWMHDLHRSLEPIPDPVDQLVGIFSFLERWFAEDDFAGCAFINAYGELGRTDPRIAERAQAHAVSFSALVDRIVERAALPPMLASSIVLLAQGAQVTAATMRSVAPAREARAAAAMLIALYVGR